MSLTLGMTAGVDNACIFVVKVVIDGDTFYFSDTEDKITLSTIDFDGKVLFKGSLNDIQSGVDVSQGAGSSIVSTFNLSLARYNSYTGTSNFFNEFYPATSGEYLTNREVHLGIVWSGATTTGEITWLYKYYIDSYTVAFSQINLNCLGYDELLNKSIPHYKVQKDFDNGISYFPNAPDTSVGKPLNIVYGEYSNTNSVTTAMTRTLKRVPCIVTDESKMQVSVAGHECKDDSYGQYASGQYSLDKHFDSVDQYMRLIRTTGTDGNNDNAGHVVTMFDSGAASLLGNIYLKLDAYSPESDVSDLSNATDNDLTNYIEIDADEWATFKVSGSESTKNFGYQINDFNTQVALFFYIASNDAGGRDGTVGIINNTLGTPATSNASATPIVTGTTPAYTFYQFATTTTAKKDSEAWTIEELCSLDYVIQNDEPSPTNDGDKIRVYYGYVSISNIAVFLDYTKVTGIY